MISSNRKNRRATRTGAELDYISGYSKPRRAGASKKIKRAINKRARQWSV